MSNRTRVPLTPPPSQNIHVTYEEEDSLIESKMPKPLSKKMTKRSGPSNKIPLSEATGSAHTEAPSLKPKKRKKGTRLTMSKPKSKKAKKENPQAMPSSKQVQHRGEQPAEKDPQNINDTSESVMTAKQLSPISNKENMKQHESAVEESSIEKSLQLGNDSSLKRMKQPRKKQIARKSYSKFPTIQLQKETIPAESSSDKVSQLQPEDNPETLTPTIPKSAESNKIEENKEKSAEVRQLEERIKSLQNSLEKLTQLRFTEAEKNLEEFTILSEKRITELNDTLASYKNEVEGLKNENKKLEKTMIGFTKRKSDKCFGTDPVELETPLLIKNSAPADIMALYQRASGLHLQKLTKQDVEGEEEKGVLAIYQCRQYFFHKALNYQICQLEEDHFEYIPKFENEKQLVNQKGLLESLPDYLQESIIFDGEQLSMFFWRMSDILNR